MVDYFDEDGEILIKLYKDTNEGKEYWESWNISSNSAIAHWGRLGDIGQKNIISAPTHKELKDDHNKLINEKIGVHRRIWTEEKN